MVSLPVPGKHLETGKCSMVSAGKHIWGNTSLMEIHNVFHHTEYADVCLYQTYLTKKHLFPITPMNILRNTVLRDTVGIKFKYVNSRVPSKLQYRFKDKLPANTSSTFEAKTYP